MTGIVAHSCNLGSLGSLVYFKTPRESSQKQWPIPIFIVDKSASMLIWSEKIINEIIPNALECIGYPKDGEIHLITFESKVGYHKTTINGLRLFDARSGGGTHITYAIKRLNSVLEETQDLPITIYIISDGEIYDKQEALTFIETIVHKQRNTIRTGYCRLETSKYCTPDTRVLASLAAFNNIGASRGINVKAVTHNDDVESSIANSIYLELAEIVNPFGTVLETKNSVLRHLPNEKPMSRMFLPIDRDVTFFLSNQEETVECGGQKMSFIQNKDLLSDTSGLDALLHVLDSRIRHLRVGGSPQMHREADELMACLDALDNVLSVSQNSAIKAADRLKRLKHTTLRKYKQMLCCIREMGNNMIVSELSDKQQAEFLTQKPISRSLAKRAKKIDPSLDYEGLCHKALRRLTETKIDDIPRPTSDGPIMTNSSFCSCDTFAEIIDVAYEATNELSDQVIDGLMTIIGGIGVAFASKHTDLPDPWQIQVQKVYCGEHYLSECDLQTARAIDKNITYPGFGSTAIITGVVPLYTIDKKSYRTYTSKLQEIAQLHASVALRGRFARIPGDIPARIAGVLVGVCNQIGPTSRTTEPQRKILDELFQTAVEWFKQNPTKYSKVVEALKSDNPTGWLSGEEGYDVNSSLKPRFVFLASQDCEEIRTDLQKRQRIMRALYTLHVYCECRRFFRSHTKARKAKITTLLGVDLKNKKVPVGDYFEKDEKYKLTATIDYSNAYPNLTNSSWCQDPIEFASLLRCLYNEQDATRGTLGQGVEEIENEENLRREPNIVPRAVNVLEAYGVCDENLLRFTAAIEALCCTSENDRIDKTQHVALGPDYGDPEMCLRYLEKVHDQQYRLDYEERLKEKKTYEKNHTDERYIKTDVECKSLDAFAEGLNRKVTTTKPTSSVRNDSQEKVEEEIDVSFYKEGNSRNFTKLEERLLKVSEEELVPFRLEKLWMIITGHYPPPSLKVAWAKGNIVRRNLNKFKKVIQTLDRDTWPQICDFVNQNKEHVYRESKFNRHGHGKENPSYLALGYSSLADMLEKIGWDKCLSYSKKHGACCGFPYLSRNL